MDKSKKYWQLEEDMLKYSDLISISVKDCGEEMINLSRCDWIRTRQIDERMTKYTGKDIFTRKYVVNRLRIATKLLQKTLPAVSLEVVYGYRALEIQTKLFDAYWNKLGTKYTDESELLEAVHRLVAVPEVSGHPTGGAIDLQIVDLDGNSIDFGTKIWEFVNDSYTFSPFVSKRAWQNRQLLRGVMISSGFAPFDGEWWHFSYGDREWACYYGKRNAIYDQIEFKV